MDPTLASQWLVAELIAPGGDAKLATQARAQLLRTGSGDMVAQLALGFDDWLHGRIQEAPEHYLRAVEAARISKDPRAPLVAWFAVNQATEIQTSNALWKKWKPFVENALKEPGNLGWRARIELVDWWLREAYDEANQNIDALSAKQLGCAPSLRLAGPFGTGARADLLRAHAAEAPGPWPERWQPAPGRGDAPHILKTKTRGCFIGAEEATDDGVFYTESFLDLEAATDVLIAVQGAAALWVDDTKVLDRDSRRWGIWPKFGVELHLSAGRHRILGRIDKPRTSVRLMHPDGRPLPFSSRTDPALPYVLTAPEIRGEPNLVSRFVRDGRIVEPPDLLTRFLVAALANIEGQGDVASAAIQPLVSRPSQSTGPVLISAARFAGRDPIYAPEQARDLSRELVERAAKRDPGLWWAQLALAQAEIERSGAAAGVKGLERLAEQFKAVPEVQIALVQLYGSLGWSTEYTHAAAQLAITFPESVAALATALEVYDQQGRTSEADALVERIRKLDGDSEVLLTRALEREDYPTALNELRRLAQRRPTQEILAERIVEVMVRAGNDAETWAKLEKAVSKAPRSGPARLAQADFRFAEGKHDALRRSLVEAIQKGASTSELEEALDLVEGMTELEPYRLEALAIIRAYEQSGQNLPGHAARVLDYSALWIKSDGSSRMLEHEVVRIQSPEAITKMAEQRVQGGLVLHMRVIKKDGRVLEPELVSGKQTVTMPHLEVGDYIETEHIASQAGDGHRGMMYEGPRWFFREENVAYARSEFVVISPKSKPLIVEKHGDLPPPEVKDLGALTLMRWRVDSSPAAPSEPFSPPATEFLPSVHVGWGIDLEGQLRRFSDLAFDITPIDPRVVAIAQRIVKPLPASARTERAQKLYRWVLDNVEEGNESDGRRVVVGKQGQRARGFEALCRALGIPVEYAVARNRLAPPPVGPLEQANLYSQLVMRVKGTKDSIWLTVGNKFAPFGYIPAEVRDMPAYVISGPTPVRVTTPSGGSLDSIEYEGDIELQTDGSARIALVQRFVGSHAVTVRNQLEQLSESRLPDVLQGLAAQLIRGAHLVRHRISKLDALDSPLELALTLEVPAFAQREGSRLLVSPPFPALLSGLTPLPARQTPLLMAQAMHRVVRMKIHLPKGAEVVTKLGPIDLKESGREIRLRDRTQGGVLHIDREVDLAPGRIQPSDYAAFVDFARRADDAQTAGIRIQPRAP